MSDIGLDVGQANELKMAFRRHDWSNENIKRLCESSLLTEVLRVMRGDSEIVSVDRVVNLNVIRKTDPSDPVVIKHLEQGVKKWREIRFTYIDPYDLQYTTCGEFSEEYEQARGINPETIQPWYLNGQTPANICLRDFLIENPHLMPKKEFRSPILFWGTIFKSPYKNRHPNWTVPGIHRNFDGSLRPIQRFVIPPTKEDFNIVDYRDSCVVLI